VSGPDTESDERPDTPSDERPDAESDEQPDTGSDEQPEPDGVLVMAPPTPGSAAPPRAVVEVFAGWRGPSAPPTWPVLGAAAAVGVTAAAAVPNGRPGLGWFILAIVAAVAVVPIAREARRHDPAPPTRLADVVDAAWGLAAVGLAGVAAVRDAPWLVALCLLAAAGAASIAVAGRHFRSVVFTSIAVPVAAFRALPWVSRALARARHGSGRRSMRTATSAAVGACLLAVFAPLLAAADPAFAQLLDDLLPSVDGPGLVRWIFLFGLGAGALLGVGFLLLAPPTPAAPRPDGPLQLRRVEWALPIGLLVGLFGLFVGVQFAALFGSDDYVRRTTGLTYAEYARGGFWQLLAVTILALGVVLLASRYAPAPTPADRGWKRGLLATLTAFTLVIVASALSRMWLYQETYGFTTLRLVVLTCELWLGACFVLVLVAVLRLRAGPVVREMTAAGVVALLALAMLNPDRFVAGHNVARHAATGELDTVYLGTLSLDAVPALLELPEQERCAVLPRIADELVEPDTHWTSWNAARSAAREALADINC
jgi:uncharacterized protein DUF4153